MVKYLVVCFYLLSSNQKLKKKIGEYAKNTECFSFHVFVTGFPRLLRSLCKVDESAKMRHSKLEGSGAFCVSVVLSHLAHLRYMTATPSPCGQWLRPLEEALEEIQWCSFMSVSHLGPG